MIEPIFKIKDGSKVWDYGTVTIEGVEHLCVNGFIKCDSALNSRSWNTTPKTTTCKECFPINKNFVQLVLF